MSTTRFLSALFASFNSYSSSEDDSMSFIFRFDEDLGRGFSNNSCCRFRHHNWSQRWFHLWISVVLSPRLLFIWVFQENQNVYTFTPFRNSRFRPNTTAAHRGHPAILKVAAIFNNFCCKYKVAAVFNNFCCKFKSCWGHHVYKAAWSPILMESLAYRNDAGNDDRKESKVPKNTQLGLTLKLIINSFLIFTFLKARHENKVQVKMSG